MDTVPRPRWWLEKKYGVILAVKNFSENLYDGDTLPATFEQMRRVPDDFPTLGIADRGCRGRKRVAAVKILIPENQGSKTRATEKLKNC